MIQNIQPLDILIQVLTDSYRSGPRTFNLIDIFLLSLFLLVLILLIAHLLPDTVNTRLHRYLISFHFLLICNTYSTLHSDPEKVLNF